MTAYKSSLLLIQGCGYYYYNYLYDTPIILYYTSFISLRILFANNQSLQQVWHNDLISRIVLSKFGIEEEQELYPFVYLSLLLLIFLLEGVVVQLVGLGDVETIEKLNYCSLAHFLSGEMDYIQALFEEEVGKLDMNSDTGEENWLCGPVTDNFRASSNATSVRV